MRRLERRIGYRLTFPNIPDLWVKGWMTFDMEKSWAKHGIRAEGVNYFTLGSLENAVSSRYLRNKKQYQSWLGAYLVKFKEKKSFTLQDHLNLAVADQRNWLRDFGDPLPYYEMPGENSRELETIEISGYPAKLYWYSGGPSHSDVGSRSRNFRNKILMALMASMINRSNPSLNLKMLNFLPKDIHTEYETVLLKGYIAIVELDENTKVIFYGNGASILDESGKEITDYTDLIKEDILIAFNTVKIDKL